MSALDGKAFIADEWYKPEDSKLKGYGRTCILDGGNILEKVALASPMFAAIKCLLPHHITVLK